MSLENFAFKTKSDFIQAAFNQVALIVSEHGYPSLECMSPALSTEQCLRHLAVVASDWSYDFSEIDKLLDVYKKSNAEIQVYLGDFD